VELFVNSGTGHLLTKTQTQALSPAVLEGSSQAGGIRRQVLEIPTHSDQPLGVFFDAVAAHLKAPVNHLVFLRGKEMVPLRRDEVPDKINPPLQSYEQIRIAAFEH